MEMSTDKDIEGKLVAFICRNFMVETEEFNLEESLVDQGVIDSMGLVEIAAFMEREFGMVVVEDDMNREHFGSVNKMVTFIMRVGAL
jgi:acyl carrier protein